MDKKRWLLPDGIDELLPAQARHLEALRRELLDLMATWGYEMVVTPFVEYLDALLTGTGKDLAHATFKLTDELSGRTLGIRADITPQAARIDAHQLGRTGPTRLCYIGSVLHTRPDGYRGSRSPLQLGAELFGHAGIESDIEVLRLMLAVLDKSKVSDLHLDLGHVGIYRTLMAEAELSPDHQARFFDALQRKSVPELDAMVGDVGLRGAAAERLLALVELNGGAEILGEARRRLAGAGSAVMAAIDDVEAVAEQLQASHADVPLHFDLAELRAYHYQTGIVFAAFVPQLGKEIARGGRYDRVGEVFGRARPATGFSTDLKHVLSMGNFDDAQPAGCILAPWQGESGLDAKIDELRGQGERVVRELPGQAGDLAEMGCDRRLVVAGSGWAVQDI